MKNSDIKINLFFSYKGTRNLKQFCIKKNTTIGILFKEINIEKICPFFDKFKSKIGVYGEMVSSEYILKDDDRVEIYETIKIDPKTRRQLLARGKKKIK